jgi:hypothetical protein
LFSKRKTAFPVVEKEDRDSTRTGSFDFAVKSLPRRICLAERCGEAVAAGGEGTVIGTMTRRVTATWGATF